MESKATIHLLTDSHLKKKRSRWNQLDIINLITRRGHLQNMDGSKKMTFCFLNCTTKVMMKKKRKFLKNNLSNMTFLVRDHYQKSTVFERTESTSFTKGILLSA